MIKKIFGICFLLFFNFWYVYWDIKWISSSTIWITDFLIFQFLFILLLIFLYLYDLYFKKNISINNIKNDNIKEKKDELILKLKKLKKDSEKFWKSEFYSQLNINFREYFEIIGLWINKKLSLNEIKSSSLDKKIIELYEKSYINEYNNKNDIKKIRIEIIDDLIKLIK